MNLSMLSGVSGIRSHQTMLDVVGNNVANVNTPGFKSSRAAFEDVLSRNLRSATSGSGETVGGTNPLQVGIGSGVGSISRDVSQGAFTPTGSSFDLAIDGEGFFSVQKSSAETLYTRVGAFGLDFENKLMDKGTGFLVLDRDDQSIQIDKSPNASGAQYIDSVVEQDGTIVTLYDDGSTNAVGDRPQIGVYRFNNPAGLDGMGHNMFQATLNSGPKGLRLISTRLLVL